MSAAGTGVASAGAGGVNGFTIQGTVQSSADRVSLLAGSGTHDFDDQTSAGLVGGGSPGSTIIGSLALLAPSSVTVRYTCDALPAVAVPEPGSLALVAIASLGAAAVRRRSVD